MSFLDSKCVLCFSFKKEVLLNNLRFLPQTSIFTGIPFDPRILILYDQNYKLPQVIINNCLYIKQTSYIQLSNRYRRIITNTLNLSSFPSTLYSNHSLKLVINGSNIILMSPDSQITLYSNYLSLRQDEFSTLYNILSKLHEPLNYISISILQMHFKCYDLYTILDWLRRHYNISPTPFQHS